MNTKYKFLARCLCLVSAGLLLSAHSLQGQDSAAKKQDKFDASSIQGSWKMDSGMKSGEKVDGQRLPGTVTIDDESFTMPAGPDAQFVMAYEIDAEKSPMQIDFEITEGPAEGTAKGIIKMEDGKLTLCYHPMGGDRPEKFESSEENGCYMFVMSKAGSKFDAADLKGTWSYVSGLKGGIESGDEVMQGQVVIDEKTFTLPAGPDTEFVMSYTIDASQTPAAIDLKIEEGPVPDGTAKGIIKLEDGAITLCYNGMGGERPEKFESDEDNQFFMFVLEKQDR